MQKAEISWRVKTGCKGQVTEGPTHTVVQHLSSLQTWLTQCSKQPRDEDMLPCFTTDTQSREVTGLICTSEHRVQPPTYIRLRQGHIAGGHMKNTVTHEGSQAQHTMTQPRSLFLVLKPSWTGRWQQLWKIWPRWEVSFTKCQERLGDVGAAPCTGVGKATEEDLWAGLWFCGRRVRALTWVHSLPSSLCRARRMPGLLWNWPASAPSHCCCWTTAQEHSFAYLVGLGSCSRRLSCPDTTWAQQRNHNLNIGNRYWLGGQRVKARYGDTGWEHLTGPGTRQFWSWGQGRVGDVPFLAQLLILTVCSSHSFIQGLNPLLWLCSLYQHPWLGDIGLMQSPASSVHGVVTETRQTHMDYQVLWRKRDGSATLLRGDHLGAPWPLCQEESTPTLALTGFYWLNLHSNTGCIWKAHQSFSVSNNQIDNIQRTLRAYFESGSDS